MRRDNVIIWNIHGYIYVYYNHFLVNYTVNIHNMFKEERNDVLVDRAI